MYYKKKLIALVLVLVLLLSVSCQKKEISEKVYESDTTTKQAEETTEKEGQKMSKEIKLMLSNGKEDKELVVDLATHPIVTMEINDGNKIELVLLPELAPNTVNNFIELINKGYYDGLIFHRVIKNFMIQGGCPDGTGTGTPGYNIKAEFTDVDGFMLPHTPGVISMARRPQPDTAGSQFFIVHGDARHLNGQYASFGAVINAESMNEVDKIAGVSTGAADRPNEEVVMTKVTVELNGYEAKEAEKIK